MAAKVYGIEKKTKTLQEVPTKRSLRGTFPAMYRFTQTTNSSGAFSASQAAASPEITMDSAIIAVNVYDAVTGIKKMAGSNIVASINARESRIELEGTGLEKNKSFLIDVYVAEIPKVGQTD